MTPNKPVGLTANDRHDDFYHLLLEPTQCVPLAGRGCSGSGKSICVQLPGIYQLVTGEFPGITLHSVIGNGGIVAKLVGTFTHGRTERQERAGS